MDITISADWIPVISGLAGASGAVGAQFVAAWATGRRERRAVEWRREDVRAAAFADQKLALFVKVLKVVDDALVAYDELLEAVAQGDGFSAPTGVLDGLSVQEWIADFDLLAPDVAPSANTCFRALRRVDYLFVALALEIRNNGGPDPETQLANEYSDRHKEVRERRADLRDAMRVSMGVADAAPKVRWDRANTLKARRAVKNEAKAKEKAAKGRA